MSEKVCPREDDLRAMLDSARDYIAEGGLCSRMVGARELVAEIDAALNASHAGERQEPVPAPSAPQEQPAQDSECICRGNWRAIIKECGSLFGKRYRDVSGKEWRFFGVVHSDDDYYYGMSTGKELILLSCVASIATHGYTPIEPDLAAGLNLVDGLTANQEQPAQLAGLRRLAERAHQYDMTPAAAAQEQPAQDDAHRGPRATFKVERDEPPTRWLIERGQQEGQDPPLWYVGESKHPEDAMYGGRWTENANRGIWFSAQRECETAIFNEFARYKNDPRVLCHASEHVFLAPMRVNQGQSAQDDALIAKVRGLAKIAFAVCAPATASADQIIAAIMDAQMTVERERDALRDQVAERDKENARLLEACWKVEECIVRARNAESLAKEQRGEIERARALLREVMASGISYEARSYSEVQLSNNLLAEINSCLAAIAAAQPSQEQT